MTQINADKVVVYGVEIPTPAIQSNKVVLYAVEMVPASIELQKTVVYAVEAIEDFSRPLKQETGSLRPLYKTGAVKHLSFAPVGSSLFVALLEDASWTMYRVPPTGSTVKTTFTGNTMTVNSDFNQVFITKTSRVTNVFERLVEVNMRKRIV